MRRKIVFAVCVLFFALPSPTFAEKKIKIGVSTALTGAAATYGQDIRNALLFANERFADGRYDFVFEDDKCNGKDAVSVAHKLINVDKVSVVLGMACSGAALAAAPLYQRAKVPVIASSASSPELSSAGDYIFRTTPSDLEAGRKLKAHVAQKHRRFAIVSEETEYAQGLKQAFLDAPSKRTIEVIEEEFASDTTDFKTQLLRLRAKNIEGLFANAQTESTLAIIVKQIRDLGWNVPIYGVYFPGSPSFINVVAERADGIEFIDIPGLDQILNEGGEKIFSEFSTKYGELKSLPSVWASTVEAFRAVDRAYQENKQVKDYLFQTKFQGIFGDYSFDRNGDIRGLSFVVKTIVDGKVVPLAEENS